MALSFYRYFANGQVADSGSKKRRRKLILISGLILLLVFCAGGYFIPRAEGAGKAEDYIPYKDGFEQEIKATKKVLMENPLLGRYWESYEFVWRKTYLPETTINGRVVTPMKITIMKGKAPKRFAEIRYSYHAKDEKGYFSCGYQKWGEEKPIVHKPVYFFPNKIENGTRWADDYGDGQIMAVDEVVVVPAGRFTNCIKVRVERKDNVQTSWFAPGVGMVKVEYNSKGSESLEELISWKNVK